MSRPQVIIFTAALIVSTALIVPTSSVGAQKWTTVTHNNRPIVQGSGRVLRQARPISTFEGVEVMGSEAVEIRFGHTPQLVIAADDNVLPLIKTSVIGGTLKISARGSFRTRNPIRIWLTTPSLSSVRTHGSGDVKIFEPNADRLSLTTYGSGGITATGQTRRVELSVYGSGSANLAGLAASTINASVFGSGNATVRAKDHLDATAFGSGSLYYIGLPRDLKVTAHGTGQVRAVR